MIQHEVRPGQVYESCRPQGGIHTRIRIVSVGGNRADVVDAGTGRRPRSVLITALHPSGETSTGRPRRWDYRLVEETSGKTTPRDD